jgi:hypothetical protein
MPRANRIGLTLGFRLRVSTTTERFTGVSNGSISMVAVMPERRGLASAANSFSG